MPSRTYFPYALLALAVFAVYVQSLGFGFIQLDDPKHIFENPVMLSPSPAGLWSIWTAPYFSLYIPVTYTFWFLASCVSHSPIWFHFLNILIHLANALLCYALIDVVLKSRNLKGWSLAPLIGALFFALHPIQSQAVSWISTTKDLLSALFSFLALLSWSQQAQKKDWGKFGWLAGVFYVMSFLSKPSSALLPAVAWLLFPSASSLKSRNVRALGLGFLVVAPLMILTKSQQPDAEVQILVPLFDRFFVCFDALGFYLAKVVGPYPLVLDYGRNPSRVASLGFLNFYFWLGVVAALGLAWLLRKKMTIGFVFLASLMTILPVLGWIPFQFQVFSTVADHYAYFFLAIAAIGLAIVLQRIARAQIMAAVLVLALSGVTCFQLSHWQGDEALFGYNLKWNPASFLAHNNLGFYLFYTRRPSEAVDHFRETVRLRPTVPELKRNLAGALAASGRTEEAQRLLSN